MGKTDAAANIKLKRDDPTAAGDNGARILIDPLRPAAGDHWSKNISLNIRACLQFGDSQIGN